MRKKEKEVTDIHGIESIIQRSDVCRLAFADLEKKIEGLNSIMSHYAGNGSFTYKPDVLERTTILRLEITEMTGKKS